MDAVIIVVVIIIILALFSLTKKNKPVEEKYPTNTQLDAIISICLTHVHYGRPPLKVSSLLDDPLIKKNFNRMGYHLLSGYFMNGDADSNIFDYDVELDVDQRTVKEIIISINEDKLLNYNEKMTGIEDILFDLSGYTESDDSITLPIRGINFRGLTVEHVGAFDGYIMTEKNNTFDKYAIGVYGSDHTHFGFIEKGQKLLYNKMESQYGYIDGKLEIDIFIDDNTYKETFEGTITIPKTCLK